MSGHLDREALGGLAMLDERDPERVSADEHAASCAACRAELDRARRALGLLDALPAPPAPRREMLVALEERLVAEVQRGLERASLTRPVAVAVIGAMVGTVLLARTRATDAGSLLEAGLVFAAALIAVVLGTRARGARGLAVAGALVGLDALFALATSSAGGLAPAVGVKCITIELVASLAPLGVAYFRERRAPVSDPGAFAAAAAAGAFAASGGLHLTCPEHGAAHLFAFHVVGVALAALLGYATGIRVQRARAR